MENSEEDRMSKMNSSNETKVLEYIKTNGEMTTGEGSKLLGVSESIIRRIFVKLQKEGEADRIFGGIKAISEEGRYRYKEIAVQNVAEKKEIGAVAAKLVKDGEFIYLDSGTTSLEMCRALAKRLKKREIKNLTAITNSIKNLDILATYCDVILVGGKYSKDRKDVSGNLSETFLSQFRLDKSFLGTDGFTFADGFMSTSVNVSILSRKASMQAEKTYVLMDSSKIGKLSFGISCKLEHIDGLVVDLKITDSDWKRFEEKSVKVITKKEGGQQMIWIVPENIDSDSIGILICSHGSIGPSMIEATQMIYGECRNIACMGLEPTDDIEDWGKELENLVNIFPKGTIVLLDLFGGTPCNQYLINMAGEMTAQKKGRICAVSGVNLSMLLEAIEQRESISLEDMPEILTGVGKDAVINVMQKMKK